MRSRSLLATLLAGLVLLLAGCGGSKSTPSTGSSSAAAGGAKGSVTVASAGFTESKILAAMYAGLLTKAGFTVKSTDVQSTEIFQSSLEKGTIDVVPEYVATYADLLNTEVNGKDAAPVSSPDLAKSLAALKGLAAKKGLSVLTPTKAVDQNAFAVSQAYATANNLKSLSDLGKLGKPVVLAAGSECATRPFCQPGLEKTYGIKVGSIKKLGVDTAQTKSAVQKGEAQLGLVLTTDGTLADYKLVALADDKKLQNADYLVAVANAAALKKYPAIGPALDKLSAVLTTADLAAMNKQVDAERQKPEDVANTYLKDKSLV